MSTFFAWVVPAYSSGSPVDHTWVTSYDSRQHVYPDIAAVKGAKEAYWYCWGVFHPKGNIPGNTTGFIGSKDGDRTVADCLVLPNAESGSNSAARGTIFTYGIDGVCHQLANQVLYATAAAGAPPLTVKAARGYWLSTFLYGTYGLQYAAWQAKLHTCAGVKPMTGPPTGAEDRMAQLPDDFEAHAREVLADKPELVAKLLSLRADVTSYAAQRMPGFFPPDADFLNARNQHLIAQAAALLDADDFRKIFGIDPGERIDIVDPTIMEQSNE